MPPEKIDQRHVLQTQDVFATKHFYFKLHVSESMKRMVSRSVNLSTLKIVTDFKNWESSSASKNVVRFHCYVTETVQSFLTGMRCNFNFDEVMVQVNLSGPQLLGIKNSDVYRSLLRCLDLSVEIKILIIE